jgi:D-3-phosphoglycerate dehydrogenase
VSAATAELTWALILMSVRRLPREMASLKAGRWQSSGMGGGLRGKTLGIWGYGQIGKQVAGFGRAFGMDVRVWSRPASLEQARADGLRTFDSKEALFTESDIVSLHMRLSPETQASVTHADLRTMKSDALLVNTSRARLVEDGALVRALREGRPGMAAVDVYEDEPMTDVRHPLLSLENVICTPHLGYVETNQFDDMYGDQFRRFLAFIEGRPEHIANPEVLAHPGSRR